MDAHVFRRCCEALVPLLTGVRLEKIQSPAPDVHVFTLFAQGRKQYLYLRAGRQHPFLFLSSCKSSTGAQPSAQVMRLRKYVGGRRVTACVPDWAARRLSLLCGMVAEGAHAGEECWLVLDLREGPSLWMGWAYGRPVPAAEEDAAPESCEEKGGIVPPAVRWPAPDQLEEACAGWRSWPVITPALRRTLPHLDRLDQLALLADLEYGGGDLFCYAEDGVTDAAMEISAWPLPAALRRGRVESVREDVLAAVAEVASAHVLGELTRAARASAAVPLEKEAARLGRILEKQCAEEARLTAMCAAQEDALALQAVLWQFPADMKAAVLDVPPAETAAPGVPLPAAGGELPPPETGWRRLRLDPRLTLRGNMEALFHRARRGRRGLAFVAERRAQVQRERDAALEAAARARMGLTPALAPRKAAAPEAGAALARALPRGVQGFVSSDGFAILRGRDVKGNLAVLRLASPHDVWLHVEGGPGAHAVIRRGFAGQEVPERTLLEAGALVACKSWQRDSDRASVLYAEARHVKPMRNAAPGKVRIDKVLTTRVVPADPDAEKRLSLPG